MYMAVHCVWQDGSSRSNKARVYTAGALQDVQMRPAANSLMFTANKLSKPQPQLPLAPVQQSECPAVRACLYVCMHVCMNVY